MYLYNPEIMIPCFLEEDLHWFELCLGLRQGHSFTESQGILLQYKSSQCPNLSNHQFMAQLYGLFGHNSADSKMADEEKEDELNRNIGSSLAGDLVCSPDPIDPPKAKKDAEGRAYYPRDPKNSAIALQRANYTCEHDPSHYTFIRKKDGTNYTEVHHLIPMCFQGRFKDASLDHPANIVSLCSQCHNEGITAETASP